MTGIDFLPGTYPLFERFTLLTACVPIIECSHGRAQKASLISAQSVVREVLLDMQREVARQHNVVMDGRDIGTVVLPEADVKIFLTATAEVRAQRRTDELIAKGQKADYNKILQEIKQRDYQDTHRPIAPLKMSRDSVKVDTTEMTIEQVVETIRNIVAHKVGI